MAADFDFKNPDYAAVIKRRAQALERLRADPTDLPLLKSYYRDNPAQFITDWGVTCDPNNISRGLPVRVPFILFPKQIEWVNWVIEHWRNGEPGITEKSRQSGLSWLLMALSCTLCLFYPGLSIGVGSRKEELLDRRGDPKSLFEKGRLFMQNLPAEFRGTWDRDKHSPHMRITFANDSTITGEAGDQIGRGGTFGLYLVDESAFLPNPELVDASLSQATGCRIDVSTPNGRANSFAERRFSGKVDVFTFHWRDDPRKDEEWYRKQCEQLDPVVISQELDLDFAGSIDNALIPSGWIQAAVDAHLKLDITPTGNRRAALDVADVGRDLNAFCGAHGVVVQHLAEWSGKGLDLMATTAKAFNLCDDCEYTELAYDADGLGAGVRGDARTLNASRKDRKIKVTAFRGSESPLNPAREDVAGRKNQDFFANRKSQGWWALRRRFEVTYKAVTEGGDFDPDDIISLPSGLPLLQKLMAELVQPTYSISTVGKILINKSPAGARSPNLADALMIAFAPVQRPMKISQAMLDAVSHPDPYMLARRLG